MQTGEDDAGGKEARTLFDDVMAALRAGHRMQLGGGRSFDTYALERGALVVVHTDDGIGEERPCDEARLRAIVDEEPDVFREWVADMRWLDGVILVLRRVWDPIGHGRIPDLPLNEYASYVPHVLNLLAREASDDAIAALLNGFEIEAMGLLPTPRGDLDATIAALRAVPRRG